MLPAGGGAGEWAPAAGVAFSLVSLFCFFNWYSCEERKGERKGERHQP